MTRRAFAAARLFDGANWHENCVLVTEGGKVVSVAPEAASPEAGDVSDFGVAWIVPGFVDLQVNGGGGTLLNNDPSVAGIETICAAHVGLGTTALLPTLVTDTPDHTERALTAGIAASQRGVPGFAGLHIEGPHLSLARKGAHDPDLIRPMKETDLQRLLAARPRLPALLTTVAAESVTPEQVAVLSKAGILVSIGHSDAGYDSVSRLVSAGASMATHLFNAMSQLGNREPGLVGAALDNGALSAGIIVDGFHVHPASIGVALRAKRGPGEMFLVSDAMPPAGTDMTEFELNGRRILRRNGRLTLENGTLAGADLDLAQAVRVLVRRVGVDLSEALRMASAIPARLAGLSDRGRLETGCRADFVVLDSELNVLETVVGARRTQLLDATG